MSEIGLNLSIYEQLRTYADKLDGALKHLNANNEAEVKLGGEEIYHILREIGTPEHSNPASQLIAIVLKKQFGVTLGGQVFDFIALANAALGNHMTDFDLRNLEAIAAAVDRECAYTQSRLRS